MTLKEELDKIDGEMASLQERRNEIFKQSLAAPEADKACPDFYARMLAEEDFERPALPQEKKFTRLTWGEHTVLDLHNGPNPRWVAVRPCDENGDRTYLGIHIGDIALGASARHNSESGVLLIELCYHNPAMYVPDLGRIVLGCGSWWHDIKKPEDLQQITDADIQSVWYVRALQDVAPDKPAT